MKENKSKFQNYLLCPIPPTLMQFDIINMAGPKITFNCIAAFEGQSHFIANKRINEQIAKLMEIVTD